MVPDDLAIIGFDNQPISQVLQITTIDQQVKEIGRNAFELFYKQTKDHNWEQEKRRFLTHLWNDRLLENKIKLSS